MSIDNLLSDKETIRKDKIELVAYDQNWAIKAQDEMFSIRQAAHADWFCDIQHMGSTAVVGLTAKPIIDIMIGVSELAKAKALVPILSAMDYQYWEDNPKKDRLFFVKGMPPYGKKRTHHVHVFEIDSLEWRNRQLFRDALQANEALQKNYVALKERLAKQFTYDREAYTHAKSDFILSAISTISA